MVYNKYIQDVVDSRSVKLPDDLKQIMLREAELMDKIGIKDSEGHKNFAYIRLHARPIAKDILKRDINKEELANISYYIYSNLHKRPINTILSFFYAVEDALNNMCIKIVKKAYPQGYSNLYMYPKYNINKWLQAMREIYAKAYSGIDKKVTLDNLTQNWGKMEKDDFKHWLAFYEEGAHKKYVTASSGDSIDPTQMNYFIPLNNLKSELPIPLREPDMDDFEVAKPKEDKSVAIENQRTKIIARLNSAERIISSPEGRMFAGDDLDKIIDTLHSLKKQILTAKKRSVMSSLFEDYIFKTANMYRNSGFNKSAAFLYKVAQDSLPEIPNMPEIPAAAPTTEPADKSKNVYHSFLKSLDLDSNEDNDSDIEVSEDMIATAQVALEEKLQQAPRKLEPIKVPEKIDPPMIEVIDDDPAETAIENAFGDVTVEDIVSKLESLSNIFRNREVPRQLSTVDIMMNTLGISSYFPGLGEAIRSALESNSYCSTRIDDILNKIKGSVKVKELDLDLQKEVKQEAKPLAEKLEEKEKKQNIIKEKRKQEEEKEVLDSKKPEVDEDVAKKLSGPVTIEAPKEKLPEIKGPAAGPTPIVSAK